MDLRQQKQSAVLISCKFCCTKEVFCERIADRCVLSVRGGMLFSMGWYAVSSGVVAVLLIKLAVYNNAVQFFLKKQSTLQYIYFISGSYLSQNEVHVLF